MKAWYATRLVPWCFLAAALTGACGNGGNGSDPSASGASADRGSRAAGVGEPCGILRAVLTDVEAIESSTVAFEPGGSTHPYCDATWRKPDAEALEAQQAEAMAAYMERRMEATARGEAFDEPMPIVQVEGKIMLTIAGMEFGDEAAAASALETVVGELEEGITVETDETTATFRSSYDEWIPGVGTRAAWSTQMSQVSVAAGNRLFHVSVRVHGDADADRDLAVELARRIADEI